MDRIEHGASQLDEAVRIDPSVYEPSEIADELARVEAFVSPVPVVRLFMDLLLIQQEDVPHAPYLAVTATTWPGEVVVYRSSTEENCSLNDVVTARSIIGVTRNELSGASAGLMDRGEALEVNLDFGALSSVTQEALLSGANIAAIGDGTSGNWELFQLQDAALIGAGVFALSTRLRGQLGSDAWHP